LWRRYKDFNKSVKTVLKNKHKKFISSLGNVCTQNPKRFWSFFRSKTKNPSLPMNVNNGTDNVQIPEEKARIFKDFSFFRFHKSLLNIA
jgi:hypothetical protein